MEKHWWRTVPANVQVFQHTIDDFTDSLSQLTADSSLQDMLALQGQRLWYEAVAHAQQSGDFDDRPLYWTRLCMIHVLRDWLAARIRRNSWHLESVSLIRTFEMASRGMHDIVTPGNEKLIVISGFDPFGLVDNISKSNPSGACVLALHQQILSAGGIAAKVTGAIFPVRYADFDRGIVESHFGAYLNAERKPDMVMTISLNRDGFKVERFAGRRRSSETFADNAGCVSGGSHQRPVEPTGLGSGPEFIETSLPAAAIRGALGRPEPLINELRFMEADGSGEPEWKYTMPAKGAQAVCGSGGGFLSNEIFYRTSLMRLHSKNPNIPMGHFHIPALKDDNDAVERKQTVDTIVKAVTATLPCL